MLSVNNVTWDKLLYVHYLWFLQQISDRSQVLSTQKVTEKDSCHYYYYFQGLMLGKEKMSIELENIGQCAILSHNLDRHGQTFIYSNTKQRFIPHLLLARYYVKYWA